MAFFSKRDNLAHMAIALLLASPATAAPSPLMGRTCVANSVSDLSCADSSKMSRCIAIEKVDAELLATCLEAAGCTEDETENALWITEKCQTGSTSADDTTRPDLDGERRRRFRGRSNNNNKRADSTTTTSEESTTATAASTSSSSSETSTTSATSTSSSSTTSTSTTSSASATSTSSNADVNIGLWSAIVGSVMGVAAAGAFGVVFICAWREGAARRKAKREAAQKEGLLSNMG